MAGSQYAQFAQCQKCLFIREYYFAENEECESVSLERCANCDADKFQLRKVTVILK